MLDGELVPYSVIQGTIESEDMPRAALALLLQERLFQVAGVHGGDEFDRSTAVAAFDGLIDRHLDALRTELRKAGWTCSETHDELIAGEEVLKSLVYPPVPELIRRFRSLLTFVACF